MNETLGLYISVPFCRAKCTYCNFASGVFPASEYGRYVERVCRELRAARERAVRGGWRLPERAGSVYLGGGTPSTLDPEQLRNHAYAETRSRMGGTMDGGEALTALMRVRFSPRYSS